MDDPVAGRAARALPAPIAALDQDLDLPSHQPLVLLSLKLRLEGEEPGEAIGRELLRNLAPAPPPGRGRAGPGGIAKGEHVREPAPANEVHSGAEILLRLAGESDDEVRRN